MRRARARAAAVCLALALGMPGCGLVDSLTPFGIGTQDYDAGAVNVNGNWAGKTATGGDVTFQVGSSEVIELLLYHLTSTAGCSSVWFETAVPAIIANGAFTIEMEVENYGQGRFVLDGRFTSATTCEGSYSFEGLPTGACPTAGRGTFVANKVL